ncbi:MAG: hypothetical protein QN152_04840 [Armatimonadota bacterium]|nr:hypothetical protein [Armatimonadota bacterium]MDR7428153.1 hypothetical protein [Armatimonadota bacterium]MDR7465645.1 hypothetical protein [Armatimonadota bacterium]MDR7470967.1 hypothetical protein [Armatimonadota bacterium]MDR7473636.1 hypothetical protein [Armatimonadota bacterium]
MRLPAMGLAFGVLLGLSFPLVAQQPPTAPSPVLIVPGQSLAGIILGRSVRGVVARLGPPSEVRVVRDGTLYVFARFGITVYGDGDVIHAVSAANSLFRTPEGIGLGSSEAEVRRVYGPQYTHIVVEGIPGVAYDHLGLAFGFDRGSVAVILVYTPHTQAQVAFVSLPYVENLKPFSPETEFMSLSGYLRYLVFQQSGIWLSYREAARIIREQATARS